MPSPRCHRHSEQIASLAHGHGGFVTRRELVGLGLTPSAIQNLLDRGSLIPHLRGVYALGHVPTACSARAHAPLLAVGERSALAGWSAVNNYRSTHRWVEPFTVITPLRAAPRGVTVLRSRQLTTRDIQPVHGLRTVSPALAALQVAPDLTTPTLIRVIDDFRIHDRLTTEQLAAVAGRFPRLAPALRCALPDLQDEPTRSDWEQEWPPFADRYGLPPYEMNVYVLSYRVDILMAGLIVMLDGWHIHGTRTAFEHDREETAELMARTGLPVLRITHRQFHRHPARQAERILAIASRT